MTQVWAYSEDPFVGVVLLLIEDPLKEELYSNLYPPTEDSLRVLVRQEIADLEFSDPLMQHIDAALAAGETARISQFQGYPAALYSTLLPNTDYGEMYVRGAFIVTDRRDVSVQAMGCVEPDAPGSVKRGAVDELWSQVMDSLEVDY